MGWKAELYPEAMPNIRQHLKMAVGRSALHGAAMLDEKLMRGTRSGRIIKGRPAQSSAPDEWPQEQTGALRRALDVREGNTETEYLVGFFDGNEKQLLELEFNPPEKGGRPLLGDHFNSADVQGAMLSHMATLPEL